jgi:hypothetical protein
VVHRVKIRAQIGIESSIHFKFLVSAANANASKASRSLRCGRRPYEKRRKSASYTALSSHDQLKEARGVR